jgi:alpha/beta superfamily hydrolase
VVLPGQYLERPALVECGELVLEGLYHRGRRRPALLVCPAPGPGGGMDAPVVAELAWAAARAGHASLRFQHRGVGASQGSPDPARTLDDALAAHAHLVETARAPVAVAGVGAGCATAVALARARGAAALALVAPEALPDLAGVAAPVLLLLPAEGGALEPGEAARRLGGAATVEVVAGADAAFRAGLTRAARAVLAFVGRGA